MPSDPSFYFAIFKRLQACDSYTGTRGGHFTENDDPELSGGFSLTYPGHPHGMFGTLLGVVGGSCPAALVGQKVLTGNPTPDQNPLYFMLDACKMGQTINVMGHDPWPVMPNYGDVSQNAPWTSFNSGGFDLVGALGTWIANGAADDTPKPAALTYATLKPGPALFGGVPKSGTPILFMCSKPGDDGRRQADLGTPTIASNNIPNFWATSPIHVLETDGSALAPGKLLTFGEEYYIAAVIGNSGSAHAGGAIVGHPKIQVKCEAQAFNTVMSNGGAMLPSLNNLSLASANVIYEQYFLGAQTYDVVGFRFNVTSVFQQLEGVIAGMNLGGLTPAAWLQKGHPCVKVFITSGESANAFHPAWNVAPTDMSDPTHDRRIAQHNLVQFDMTTPAPKKPPKPMWKNFIASQVGAGSNTLVLQHDLPAEAFRFYLAMPKAPYEHYIRQGGGFKNFEEVHDAPSKPFPDAVILREKGRSGEIVLAAHDKERSLALSLGIEYDASRTGRLGDVSMVHHDHAGAVVGGFTLQLVATEG